MPQQSDAAHIIQDFIEDFGLTDPNLFKIAYSPLSSSEVLLVGDNPGGDPSNPATVANHKEKYSHGEHDFLDERYRLAEKMRNLFTDAFGGSGDALLRSVPVTNVSFFRSPEQLPPRETRSNRKKCRPYLWRIVKIVDPSLIIANGMGVFRYLQGHLAGITEIDHALPPPAKGQQVYYRKVRGKFEVLDGREIDLVGFHHISGYQWSNDKLADLAERIRRDWPSSHRAG